MTKLILFTLFFSLNVNSRTFYPGDILLVPMKCYLCQLIEGSTNSIYSHLYIYLGKGNFAHSLGKVEKVTLDQIRNIVDSSRPSLHLRHYQWSDGWEEKLNSSFNKEFISLPYDKDFLWDNFDNSGKEKLYCSEFIVKIYEKALGIKLKIFPMDYTFGRDFWQDYFNGNIPDNLPGVSPGHFEKNSKFIKIRKYNLF